MPEAAPTPPTRKPDPKAAHRRFLARGDAACLVLFAVLGLMSHGEPVSLAGVVRNSLPILLAWWLVAPFLRTYARPGWRSLLYTWGVAVSAGVWLRAMALGRPFDLSYFIFWGLTLAVTLGLLVLWRLAAQAWWRRSAKAA